MTLVKIAWVAMRVCVCVFVEGAAVAGQRIN